MPYPHMPIGGAPSPGPDEFTFAGGAGGLYAQPVYSSGAGLISLAEANAMVTSVVVGVIGALAVAPGGFSLLATAGEILEQATALWDALCGTVGGLVPNTTYYLSAGFAGHYTAVAPSTVGQTVVPLLFALSPTQALLVTPPPIQL